jgi:hypothetical protein
MKKKFKSFLKIWLFLGVIFLVYGGYRFFSKSIWDGRSRLNLILGGEQVKVFSLNPQERSMILLTFPPNTFLKVVYGYGDYPVESIYNLGRLGEHRGEELLQASFQENLEVPIDGYLWKQKGNLSFKNLLNQALFSHQVLTNLNKWDVLRLWWQVRGIRPGSAGLVEVDLEKAGVLSEVVLADESRGFQIDAEKISLTLEKYFKDEKLRQEDIPLAILNGTRHSALAAKAKRLVNHLGGRVVEVGEWEEQISGCQLRAARSKLQSFTFLKLQKIFNCQWAGEDLGNHYAEIILILGEDYWEKINGK